MTQQYIIDKYTFNKTAKTITFPDLGDIRLEGFQLITNVTTGTIIYQFNSSAKLGTISGNVLTLVYDTTTMNNTDKLQIIYHPIKNGYFQRSLALLEQIKNAILRPEWMSQTANGKSLRTLTDPTSTLATVATVTTVTTVTTANTVTNLTNFNTIDSREVPWALQRANYIQGIRNRID